MKKLSLILLFSLPMNAMQNAVTPVSTQTDCQLVAQTLPNITIPSSLIPHVAVQIRNNSSVGQELGADTTTLIIAAADAALIQKNNTTVSKTTTAVITGLATLAGTIVTALATSYSCKP